MSKLSDYSKFDHLVESDTDDDNNEENRTSSCHANDALASKNYAGTATTTTTPTSVSSSGRAKTTKHPTIANRYIFTYDNQKIYEWEQSLDDVTMYIDSPIQGDGSSQQQQQQQQQNKNNRNVLARNLIVNISHNRLQVGLKGCDRYFIDECTYDKVKINESSWYLDEDGIITILLHKCFRGQTWESVLRGHDAAAHLEHTTTNNRNVPNEDSATAVDPFTRQEMQRSLLLERFQEEHPGFDFRDATFNGEIPDPRTFMGGVGYNH